ncbi:MAG TPA: alpha/beta hydrolase [Allocoleopsis sp.]
MNSDSRRQQRDFRLDAMYCHARKNTKNLAFVLPLPDSRLPIGKPDTPLLRRKKLPGSLGIALLNLGLLLAPVAIPSPARGAQEIYIPYGPMEFSLPVSALALYAKEGKINQELAVYAGYLDPKQLEQLRKVLVTRIDVTPVAIAQFLYSPQGKIILERIGEIVQTKAGQDGFYAIRAALILAAADPDGLTLLNVLEKFPTYGIKINSARGFQLLDELSNLIKSTGSAIAAVNRQAIAEASAQDPPPGSLQASSTLGYNPFSQKPDLRKPGSVSFLKQALMLTDLRRRRTLPVDLYLPTSSSPLSRGGLVPVIVISHGLGSDRQTFAYLAEHLASYGFAVAVPEHPGSNADQIKALINGLANEVTSPAELIDRPLDIKFLLNELERSYGKQLNLKQVGVIGQSFGGYTVLALAGAQINFEQLAKDCGPSNNSLNLSLLLQCRAEELPIVDYQLSDPRVQAAIAINPVDSTVFGESQLSKIQIPLMLVAGSDDTVAPALPEQIRPFTWLTTPNKYLVLLNDGTHFSTLAESTGGVPVPETAIGPSPALAQDYMKALSVAFFETYIAGNSDYKPYLSAAYAQFISKNPLPVSLIQSLTAEQLSQEQEKPTPEPTPSPQPSSSGQ